METATRYPLSWPLGWKRTPPHQRMRAPFSRGGSQGFDPTSGQRQTTPKRPLTVPDSIARLSGELGRLGATHELLSTNLQTRLDGLPRSGQSEPSDPGAACYFKLKAQPRCLACDKWLRVADNIAAIAQHIDALRRIDRYGIGTLDQAFAGYAALPPIGGTQGGDWRAEMGFEPTARVDFELVESRYRLLLKQRHPDSGGSHDAVVRLNLARDAARAYFKGDA